MLQFSLSGFPVVPLDYSILHILLVLLSNTLFDKFKKITQKFHIEDIVQFFRFLSHSAQIYLQLS